MSTTNSTPPDMIAQAGSLLAMLQHGKPICHGTNSTSADDRAIVQASAILTAARRELAIATQALIKIEEFSVAHQRIATNIYYQTTKALNLLHISGAAAE